MVSFKRVAPYTLGTRQELFPVEDKANLTGMVSVEENKIDDAPRHESGGKGAPIQARDYEKHCPGKLVNDEEQFT